MTETETATVPEPAAEPLVPVARRPWYQRSISDRALAVAIVAAEMVALGVFGVRHARVLGTREDEVLALFVGRSGLGSALHQVLTERGGAPLHFVAAWSVVHLGGHLFALRLVSTAFVVGALPLIALLGKRLADDLKVGVLAATLAASSWLVLFNSDFARMYAMFLFFGTLAPLMLLRALDGQRLRDWAGWWAAAVGVVASHPYGALVLAAGIATLLVVGRKERRTWAICAVPVVLCSPFWFSDLVLRSRFDVGVGGGGESLGSLHEISHFLVTSFRDVVGWHGLSFWLGCVLAPLGAVLVLRRGGRAERALVVASFAIPIAALLGARAGSHVSPETRHLIFLVPYVALFVAAAVVRVTAVARRAAPIATVLVVALLVFGQLDSARARTPDLFTGENHDRKASRLRAATWLGDRASTDTALMGYEPLYYDVWLRQPQFSAYLVARADGAIAAKQLTRYCGGIRKGAFVFDRANSGGPQLSSEAMDSVAATLRQKGYVARRFGDFIVALSPPFDGTPLDYIDKSAPIVRIAGLQGVDNGALEWRTLQLAKTYLDGQSCT